VQRYMIRYRPFRHRCRVTRCLYVTLNQKTSFQYVVTVFISKRVHYFISKVVANCTLWEVHQKRLESFEMLYWERPEKINRTDRVRNGESLHRVGGGGGGGGGKYSGVKKKGGG